MPGPKEPTPTDDTLDALFAPAKRVADKKHIGGPTRAAVGAGGSSATAKELSERYKKDRRLDFGDRIANGFCDYVGDGVVVDFQRDEKLLLFVKKVQKKLQKAADPVTAIMVIGLFISELCGKSGAQVVQLEGLQRELVAKGRLVGELLLGALLGDMESKKRNVGKQGGACLTRHRALVFKCVTDALGVIECTLECDASRVSVGWNRVKLDQVAYVVDLLLEPGALYEEASSRCEEYMRLVEPGLAAKMLTTISAQGDLQGKVPRPPWHVEVSDLHCGRGDQDRLGKGGFGEVYRGTWAGTTVAIKVVKDLQPSDLDTLDFILEIALLSRLSHPNVMRFWRGCVELTAGKRTLLMVTENISRGGLSGVLHGHGGTRLASDFTIAQSLWLSVGVARGMQYLHSCNVLHLDLKSPNVLIDEDWTPKLCDFGLAKVTALDSGSGMQTTLRGVSPLWAPPEMFDMQAEDMTDRADVYSFGIVFFEIVCRQLPFQEVNQRMLPKAKFDGVLPVLPPSMPEDCGALVKACLTHRPSARPTMRGVVEKINEFVVTRRLVMEEIVMPPWPGSSRSWVQIGALADRGACSRSPRGTEERQSKLESERQRLLQQIEALRRQRHRVQEAHLGGHLPTDPALPRVVGSWGSKNNIPGACACADVGSVRQNAPTDTANAPKKCCALS